LKRPSDGTSYSDWERRCHIDPWTTTGLVNLAEYSGGFLGVNEEFSTYPANDYWDTTTSGTGTGTGNDGNISGLTGLNTRQLKSGQPAGFDPTIWAEKSGINGSFPYLINNPPPKRSRLAGGNILLMVGLRVAGARRTCRAPTIRDTDMSLVLVVEDEAVTRMSTASMVRDAGYEAMEAESGEQALDILAKGHPIAIILTDIGMPGPVDGFELAECVHEYWPAVRVIFVSGQLEAHDRWVHEDDMLIAKPIVPEQVHALLDEVSGQ